MEDSIQFEDAHVEVPSTPQPTHAELPTQKDIPRAMSPTTSLLVGNGSSPHQYFGIENLPPLRETTRSKYSSPPPPSSSMTPPPSSQPPKRQQPSSPAIGATTPTQSMFSSPPPTILHGLKREASIGDEYTVPDMQQIEDASLADLRQMLHTAISEVTRLSINAREARMSAAHYKLQHNLLSIETEEAAKRMEVEHEMTRREVEVLRMAEHARQNDREPGSQGQTASSRYVADLKAYCESMDNANLQLHRRLEKAKKIISQKEDELIACENENRSLLTRIRENREHLTRLKSPGGIYASATPRTAVNNGFPVTPQQYRGTPKQTPRSMRQDNNGSQSQMSFEALLLADKVLNDNSTSAPSTPTTSRPTPRAQIRHNRGVQSLSSLPSTPARSRPMTDNGNLLPSVQFAPQSEPRYRTNLTSQSRERERGRKSRDSTISASDAEEIANYGYESQDEVIPESQASQSATEMLRNDPKESMEVVGSPAPSTAETSSLLQAKIFGSITKPGVEKRKRIGEASPYEAKKQRKGAEPIGLGIGGWA